MTHQATSDIPDDFESALVKLSDEEDWNPQAMIECWNSESEVKSWVQNPNGFASGIFQLMPSSAHGLGWMPGDQRWSTAAQAAKAKNWALVASLHKELMSGYVKLNATQQLEWAKKYYGGTSIHTAAECYVKTFMPVDVPHANEPNYVLCGINGPYRDAYIANHQAFDIHGRGTIIIQDLVDRIERVSHTPRFQELKLRLGIAQGATDPNGTTTPQTYNFCDVTTLAGCQEALERLGFMTYSIKADGRGDGIWGHLSVTACESYQMCQPPLVVTGQADQATREALTVSLLTLGE